MDGIVFNDVCKNYGRVMAVNHLQLTVKEGERLILLGPSGCGKTTTLRMIAGLEKITSGTLTMGGRVVNDIEPGERNVAMVFQNYALYPHMTVWDNITFGLAIQKVPSAEIHLRTAKVLDVLNLSGYETRKPSELSGGQKQRVALARALVKQAPFFLLDEPLSNLDAQLRLQARAELVKIHEMYRSTLVYVTHDQIEAMTVGHRIAILNQGVLQQLDTPDMIYRYPANSFVAAFIGSPPMNLIQAQVQDGALWIGGLRQEIPGEWRPLLLANPELFVGIRPEHCRLDAAPMLPGSVEFVENMGGQRCIHVRLHYNGQKVFCLLPAEQELPPGTAGLSFGWENMSGFAGKAGTSIGRPLNLIHSCA
jgi:sn-glycerol 3-phosphate transport system ATP-binding protein/multiple sugar transport system ATP-binding protein